MDENLGLYSSCINVYFRSGYLVMTACYIDGVVISQYYGILAMHCSIAGFGLMSTVVFTAHLPINCPAEERKVL